MLNVKGLYHSYSKDEHYAVQDMTFQVEKGEIFGFLGPSGAGKSTTQSILFGLLELQRGEVSIDGMSVKKLSDDFFNMIGVSFESPNVYKNLTGLENLKFYSKMFNVATEKPEELLKEVGLGKDMNKKASQYSKGMLQRLVFARSMINNPKIWFLDEPTSGLDPETASRIKAIIKRKKDQGTTIFLTTHNMNIADELCDRVAFVNDGKIILIDTPQKLKLRYGERSVKVEFMDQEKLRTEFISLVDKQGQSQLQKLVETGRIVTMHSQEASLEEIFISVVGRGLI
ncbi:ABC transporter ATP-binding protein [Fusibacter sp. 3D3]|uniref:ABC transporter ATP-binding protein n=1 Tax=Fusibacter sp. 3D3 TaxID=1048380 RepID=UPI0008532C45|nr:ABC transporter ATP-binding protein [Fusibacter sp. 3D3]GAU79297.1 probable antobiotic-transport ATP-binding protein ABC transporter [Fusibacter sp. 3D3]